jgi:hypothetical protein
MRNGDQSGAPSAGNYPERDGLASLCSALTRPHWPALVEGGSSESTMRDDFFSLGGRGRLLARELPVVECIRMHCVAHRTVALFFLDSRAVFHIGILTRIQIDVVRTGGVRGAEVAFAGIS